MGDKYWLDSGSHTSRESGMCAMEWVAYIAGENHTDAPVCVSPVLQRFCIRLNDRLGDEDRQKLRPYLARCIGTADDGMDEKRLELCREFLFRTALPTWLDLAGQEDYAEWVRSMTLPANTAEARTELRRIRDDMWKLRSEALDRVRVKYGTDAAAVADAVAVAVADADVVAGAAAAADADAAAVADAVAGAAAVADAVADAAADAAAGADAVADADAGADAAAVADAVAGAAAVAAAVADADYDKTYKAVYDCATARIKPVADELNRQAIELLDRMLPTEQVEVPALPEVARELVRA